MPIFRKKVVPVPPVSKSQNEDDLESVPVSTVGVSTKEPITEKEPSIHSHIESNSAPTVEATSERPKNVSKKDKEPHERKQRKVELDGKIIANRATDAEVEMYTADHKNDVYVFGFKDISIRLENSIALLDSRLLHNIKHLHGYKEFLPLQERCIAILLNPSKPNVLVQSPTGSGKTAAFAIPAVQFAIKHKGKGPSVIIVCNTMNLAMQIKDHLVYFTGKVPHEAAKNLDSTPENTGVDVFGMFRGGGTSSRLNDNTQPDIVVATMGSLIESIEKERLKLTNLGLFIVDEADKMNKEGGFALEMRKFFDLVPSGTRDSLQIAAFSATFCDFDDGYGGIDWDNLSQTALGKMFKSKPVHIKLVGIKGYIKQRLIFIDDVMNTASVEEYSNTYKRTEFAKKIVRNTYHARKLGWLISLLNYDRDQYFIDGKYTKTAVVFVERITTSNFLATYLIMKGYKVAPLNSNYDLRAVKEILTKLVNGEIQAVISTNKLARGQDIPDLHHVIVYEMSNEFTDYKHRIGRTGRIGKGGISTALLTKQDSKHFGSLYQFLAEHNQYIPMRLHTHVEAEEEQRERYNEAYTIHARMENFAPPDSDIAESDITVDQIV